MSNDIDAERWQAAKDIFDAALEEKAAMRTSFVDEACAGDAVLRAEVLSLLEAHDSGGPVDRAMEGIRSLVYIPNDPEDLWGRRIGSYALQNELGRGGMGRVFLARRADGQFDQQVALKLLGTGGPSDAARTRFRAERQILASLNHPNIARLLDGGVSDAGQPYFVMELVQGQPIDAYCQAHRLSLDARIELMVEVCEAVQYAHQKLVVHRDLKPSNILVSEEAGSAAEPGQVKLLDFGIAKLLDPSLLEGDAPTTRTGLLPMTPNYASPEQVRGEPVTAASDVYQLGVVLYEILTGVRPYQVDGHTPSEVERIICEKRPARPSTAVGEADEAPHTGAASTHHRKALRGDLDAIVMTALRKESERRYDAVEQLAEDLRRTLDGRPVSAHPDSWTYRARKFVERHTWGVGVTALIVLLLAGYAATITWHSQRMQVALDRAQAEAQKAEQVTAFLVDLFRASDPQEAGGDPLTAPELLNRGVERADRLDDQPEIQAEMFDVVGQVYSRLGRYGDAQEFLERSLTIREDLYETLQSEMVSTDVQVASVLRKSGQYDTAEARFRDAMHNQQRLLGSDHPDLAVTKSLLAGTLRVQGEVKEAEQLLREALSVQRHNPDADSLDRAETLNILGLVLQDQNEEEEATSALRSALRIRRSRLGDPDPRVAMSLNNLAMVLRQNGDPKAAEPVYREALAVKRTLYEEAHPSTASTLSGLGLALQNQEKYDAAEPILRKALAMRRTTLGRKHPRVGGSLTNLGNVLELQGQIGEAATHFREARTLFRSTVGKTHPFVAHPSTGLGRVLMKQGHPQKAEPFLREALSIRRNVRSPNHPNRIRNALMLGRCLTELGRYDDAESLLLNTRNELVAAGTDDSSALMEKTLQRLEGLYETWEKPNRLKELRADRPWGRRPSP